jgi:hypothetical protein
VLGRQVGLHPILAIIALMSGSALAGPFGMLIAVPLAACLQVLILQLLPKLREDLDVPPLETLEPAPAIASPMEETPPDDHARLEAVVEHVE